MSDHKVSEIADLLLDILPLLRNKLISPSEAVKDTKLNPTQFFILLTLNDHGKRPTTELGKKLSILKSNVSPLINGLLEQGYVERSHSEKDRRVIYIDITQKGRDFVKDRKQKMQEKVRNELTFLEEDDRNKLEEAVHVVHTMLSKME
ncbi:MarR family transcriptional regulator [Bacillaceae bacterium S4-13-58]